MGGVVTERGYPVGLLLLKGSLDQQGHQSDEQNKLLMTATHRLSSEEFYCLMVEKNIDQLPISSAYPGEPIWIRSQ